MFGNLKQKNLNVQFEHLSFKCSNGKIYESAREAERDTGTSASCICYYLKGKTKSLKSGLHFEYLEKN